MPTRPPAYRLRPPRNRHAAHDRQRPTSAARGYDTHHRRWRDAILRRDPLCVLCAERGRDEPATTADHIIPIAIDPTRRLDLANGRGLCIACHAIVTDNFKRTGHNEPPAEHANQTINLERRGATR